MLLEGPDCAPASLPLEHLPESPVVVSEEVGTVLRASRTAAFVGGMWNVPPSLRTAILQPPRAALGFPTARRTLDEACELGQVVPHDLHANT